MSNEEEDADRLENIGSVSLGLLRPWTTVMQKFHPHNLRKGTLKKNFAPKLSCYFVTSSNILVSTNKLCMRSRQPGLTMY